MVSMFGYFFVKKRHMKKLEIDIHIKPQQYQKLLLQLVTRKPVFIFFAVLGVAAVVYLGAYIMGYFPTITTFPFPVLVFILALLFLPYIIYKKGKADYYQNPIVNERVRYMMDEDGIAVAGESFTGAFDWESILKVSESKEWILIKYKDKTSAFIPKHDMTNDEVSTFRAIVEEVPDLEISLKS